MWNIVPQPAGAAEALGNWKLIVTRSALHMQQATEIQTLHEQKPPPHKVKHQVNCCMHWGFLDHWGFLLIIIRAIQKSESVAKKGAALPSTSRSTSCQRLGICRLPEPSCNLFCLSTYMISVLSVSKCTNVTISRETLLCQPSSFAVYKLLPICHRIVSSRFLSKLEPGRSVDTDPETRKHVDAWNPWGNLALIIICSQGLIDCPGTFLSSKTASLVTWQPPCAQSHTPWFQVWRAAESANRPHASESTASGHCNEVQKGTQTARNRSMHSILYFCMVLPVSVHGVYVRKWAK